MAMDSTLKLDPSCVFFNDSVLSYTSMGPPTLSTDLGSPSHLFVERPSTAPAQISPGCGEVHEDPHKRRFPGPGYYELPSPDCVSQFPHRPASPHYSLAAAAEPARAARRDAVCGIMTQLRRHRAASRPPRHPRSQRRPSMAAAAPAAGPGLAEASIPPKLVRAHVDGSRAQERSASKRRARPDVFSHDNPRWKHGKPHAYFGRDTLTAVWKSTCVHGCHRPRVSCGHDLPARSSGEERSGSHPGRCWPCRWRGGRRAGFSTNAPPNFDFHTGHGRGKMLEFLPGETPRLPASGRRRAPPAIASLVW